MRGAAVGVVMMVVMMMVVIAPGLLECFRLRSAMRSGLVDDLEQVGGVGDRLQQVGK